MTVLVALLGLWVAALLRFVIGLRRSRRLWRTSFDTAVLLVATSCTLLWLSPLMGELAPRRRVIATGGYGSLALAAGAASIYVETLRREAPRLRVVWAKGALAVGTTVVLWVSYAVSPLARVEGPIVNPPTVAELVYTLVSHLWVGYVCLECAVVSLASMRHSPRDQRPGLLLIGIACGIAGGVCLDYVSGTMKGQRVIGNNQPVQWVGAVLLAVGVALLAGLPALVRWSTSRRELRTIEPLWAELTMRAPEVVLPPVAGGADAALRLSRAHIEILDALEVVGVPASTPPGVEGVAAALRMREAGEVPAASKMPVAPDRRSDLNQTLRLASAYLEG